MRVEQYEKDLKVKGLKALKPLYKKVFGQPAPSKFKKDDIVAALVKKYKELREGELGEDYVEAEAREAAEEAAQAEVEAEKQKASENETNDKKGKKARKGSRRSTIIEEVQFGIWDTETLAEGLSYMNDTWPMKKNRSAISGTLADMRKNRGWKVKYSDDTQNKGRICVKA